MGNFPSHSELLPLLQALPRGVHCEFPEDCLRLWWRNWEIHKEFQTAIVLAVGWVSFTPLTVGIIVVGFNQVLERPIGLICCLPILLLFGAGVIGMTAMLLALRRSEGVAVYQDRIELLQSGLLGCRLTVKEVLPFGQIARMEFGWHAPDPEEPETVPTLNLFLKRGIHHRRMLAYWMRGSDKKVLSDLLGMVVSKLAPQIVIGQRAGG